MLSTRVAAVVTALLALAPTALPVARASVLPAPTSRVSGGDVSWPNCPKGMGSPARRSLGLPMPGRGARFVVVGATDGPAFTRNPCLGSQVAWAKHRHLWISAYSVLSYPTRAQLLRYGGRGSLSRRLYRVGVAEARQTLTTLRRAGLRTPMVWVDVETVHSQPWSGSAWANNAVLSGALAGFHAAHVRTGVYSYAYAWRRITGGRRSSLPTWVPSGTNSPALALARCYQRSFSGGRVLLGQWGDSRRDADVTCPGVTRRMRAFFRST